MNYQELTAYLEKFPRRVRESVNATLFYSSICKVEDFICIVTSKRGHYCIQWNAGGWYCPQKTEVVTPGTRFCVDGLYSDTDKATKAYWASQNY